jgi:hypothetical protein
MEEYSKTNHGNQASDQRSDQIAADVVFFCTERGFAECTNKIEHYLPDCTMNIFRNIWRQSKVFIVHADSDNRENFETWFDSLPEPIVDDVGEHELYARTITRQKVLELLDLIEQGRVMHENHYGKRDYLFPRCEYLKEYELRGFRADIYVYFCLLSLIELLQFRDDFLTELLSANDSIGQHIHSGLKAKARVISIMETLLSAQSASDFVLHLLDESVSPTKEEALRQHNKEIANRERNTDSLSALIDQLCGINPKLSYSELISEIETGAGGEFIQDFNVDESAIYYLDNGKDKKCDFRVLPQRLSSRKARLRKNGTI